MMKKIEPWNIKLRRCFTPFSCEEENLAARIIIWLCQELEGWQPFTREEFWRQTLKFARDRKCSHPNHKTFIRETAVLGLNKLLQQSWLIEEDEDGQENQIRVRQMFIRHCYQVAYFSPK